MTEAELREPSWFRTIARPALPLTFTLLAFALFVAGIACGAAFPANQIWFQAPAVAILMIWFLVMSNVYRKNRARWLEQVSPPES